MDEEVITLDSSEDEEFIKEPPRPQQRSSRITFTQPHINLGPKLGKPGLPNGSDSKKAKPPVFEEDDEDVILLSDSDDEDQPPIQPKEEANILSDCPATLELGDNERFDLVPIPSPAVTEPFDLHQDKEKLPVCIPVSAAVVGQELDIQKSCNGIGESSQIHHKPLEDDDLCSDDFQSDAATEISAFLLALNPVGAKKTIMSKNDHTALGKKMWRKYDKLKTEPEHIHSKLATIIAKATKKIPKATVLEEQWTVIKELLDQFDAKTLKQDEVNEDEEAEKVKQKERKQKKIDHLEKKMNKISEKIKELEEKEADWSDEENDHNSSYLQSGRLKKIYTDSYYLLCQITGSSKLTGRPIQKRLDITEMTKYPEFEKVVQDYINSKGSVFAPDLHDIRKLVVSENLKSQLNFDSDTIEEIAKHLLTVVMEKIKFRRGRDLRIAYEQLDENPIVEDPADKDPELQRRLEENQTNRRNEAEIVAAFVIRQDEENSVPELVVEENADASPPPSDTEVETDDEDDEDDVGTVGSDTESNMSSLAEAPTEGDDKDTAVKEFSVENEPLFEDDNDGEEVEGEGTEDETELEGEEAVDEEEEEEDEIEQDSQTPIEQAKSDEIESKKDTESESQNTNGNGIDTTVDEVAEAEVDECPPSKKLKIDTAEESDLHA